MVSCGLGVVSYGYRGGVLWFHIGTGVVYCHGVLWCHMGTGVVYCGVIWVQVWCTLVSYGYKCGVLWCRMGTGVVYCGVMWV